MTRKAGRRENSRRPFSFADNRADKNADKVGLLARDALADAGAVEHLDDGLLLLPTTSCGVVLLHLLGEV